MAWFPNSLWCRCAALEAWTDLGKLTSLQVLGCDEDTLVAYYGVERFGIHLDDLADMGDTSSLQVWLRQHIFKPASNIHACM